MLRNDLTNKLLKGPMDLLKESEKMLEEAMKNLSPEQRKLVQHLKADIMKGNVGLKELDIKKLLEKLQNAS